MLDPQGIFEVDTSVEAELGLPGAPGATGPVLINTVRGLVDAGGVSETAAAHLLEHGGARRLVTFDVDQLLDYRSKRPMMVFDARAWTEYEAPVLAIDLVHDAEGTAVLVLHGREPDVQWERFVAAVCQLVERFAVSLTVSAYGIPMGVPHTRAVSSTAHATREALTGSSVSWFGRVKVPGSATSLLELRLGEHGRDAVGYAVHVPHYLAQSVYPPAAVAALTQIENVTGLALSTQELAAAADEAHEEIARQVRESEDVAGVVTALEEQYDAFARSSARENLLADAVDLPTADELGAEFEKFLSQHRGDVQGS